MNTIYKSEKSLLLAVLAVVALSVVVVGAVADSSEAATADATSIYGDADLPLRTIDFDVTLGNESYMKNTDYLFNYVAAEIPTDEEGLEQYVKDHYSKFWTASFDFSKSFENGIWAYGNDAVIAVTFYFSDGSASDIGTIQASKTVCYPVFEVNGYPYVADVVCTPDLWPSNGKYCYPVQVEAVIYSSLFNTDHDYNQV